MAQTPNSSSLLSSHDAGSAEPLEVKRGTLQVLTAREMTQGKKMEDAAQKASHEKKTKHNGLLTGKKRKGDNM